MIHPLEALLSWYGKITYPGQGSAGTVKRVDGASFVEILNIKVPDHHRSGYDGMATVHLHAREILPNPLPQNANSKLTCDIDWQNGSGGGSAQFDGAHGAMLSVAAGTTIFVRARLESAVQGQQLSVGSVYDVEAVTKWFTSGRSLTKLGLPSQPIANGTSPWFKIPRQARNVSGYVLDGTAYGSLVGRLATVPGDVRYETLIAPRQEQIANGVEWIQFVSDVDTLVFPVFELWI